MVSERAMRPRACLLAARARQIFNVRAGLYGILPDRQEHEQEQHRCRRRQRHHRRLHVASDRLPLLQPGSRVDRLGWVDVSASVKSLGVSSVQSFDV